MQPSQVWVIEDATLRTQIVTVTDIEPQVLEACLSLRNRRWVTNSMVAGSGLGEKGQGVKQNEWDGN